VATATPHPRPGLVPGQQGYDGDGIGHLPFPELRAEWLGNAKGAGPEVRPAPILGKAHRFPADAGKVDSFSGRQRRLDQGAGRHFRVDRHVRQQRRAVAECGETRHAVRHRLLGRSQRVGGKRPPSAAHLLPDHSFRAVHPVSVVRDGRRRSVLRSRDRIWLFG